MGRLPLIDGLRGYFLVFMYLNHLYFTGGFALVRINHAELGFVQDAQGFIFLSGLLVGLVYGRKMIKLGFLGGARALWLRAFELYAYTVACVTGILVLRGLLPRADEIWNVWLGGLGDGGFAYRAAGAALLYQPIYLDILPQYVVYFLAAPPLVWLCVNGRWLWVIVGSAAFWLAVQAGVHLPVAQAVNAWLGAAEPGLAMRVPFNVLAWQAIFITAMILGALRAAGKLDLAPLLDPHRTALVKASAGLLLFFAVFRLAFTFNLAPEAVLLRFQTYENRPEFGAVFLVNFALMAYLFAWTLLAGPQAENATVRWIAAALNGLFRFGPLRLLGRHSLQTYAWHVGIVYLVCWLDGVSGPFPAVTKALIAAAGIGALAGAAWLQERRGGERGEQLVASRPG